MTEHKDKTKEKKVETQPNTGAKAQLLASGLVVEGQKRAAKYAGVSTKTIQRFDKEAEAQSPPVKHYFEEGRKLYYYVNFLDELKKKEGVGTNEHRLREQKAMAGIREKKETLLDIQIKEKNDQYILKEDVEKKTIAQLIIFRQAHQRFARDVMPFLRPFLKNPDDVPAMQATINNKLRQIFEQLADGSGDGLEISASELDKFINSCRNRRFTTKPRPRGTKPTKGTKLHEVSLVKNK